MTDHNEQFDDELLSAYVDGELTGEELAQVERRLADDPQSRQLVEELRALGQEIQSLPQETVGEDLRATIMQRAERAMLLGTGEQQATLPSETSFSGRWKWAVMAVAATLLMSLYLPNTQQEEKPLASAKPVPKEDSAEVAELQLEAVEEDVADFEEDQGLVGVGGGVGGGGGGVLIDRASEAVASGVVRERAAMSAPVVASDVAADESLAEAKEVQPELQVVLTLNEGTSSFESFNQLLLSNGIALQKDFGGPKAETSGIASHASKRALSKDLSKESEADDQPTAEEKVMLVEGTPEQIENVLEACNADTRNLASVELQAENKATNQLHTQWQQWQRTGKQLAQNKRQSYGRNLLSKKAKQKAKQKAAQSPIQVLFILKQHP